MASEKSHPAITIRFALPAEELRPFITTFYCTEVVTSGPTEKAEDWLHPEWPNLRFAPQGMAQAAIGNAPLETCPAFTVNGPTSHATRFTMHHGRAWGIGLMPLGWAALFGALAGDYADRFVDGQSDHAFAALHPLAEALAGTPGGFDEELAVINEHLRLLDFSMSRHSEAIIAVNAALVDPEVATVSVLADRAGMSIRSLERLSRRAFGFTPKLLLRRQRFLRSLAQFMLDPSMKWLNTLDGQYHDQAHFVRDFRRFMGMSPSAYAKLEKPMLVAAARARMAIAGEAVQGLHAPGKPA